MVLLDRRAALGVLIPGCVGASFGLVRSVWASMAEDERYPSLVEITSDDIAWFRQCRSVWITGESGAPAVVPSEIPILEYARILEGRMEHVRNRLERTLCAFFVHAGFEPGRYTLSPAVSSAEGFAGAPEVAEFVVTADHVRLLQRTDWRLATINTKRPYGNIVYCEIEIAQILGIPLPPIRDGEDLPSEIEAPLRKLHHELLFVLQAYLQHARLEPGKYRIPFDGWEHIHGPRCHPATEARIETYVQAWKSIKQSGSDGVIPKIRAADLLFGLD